MKICVLVKQVPEIASVRLNRETGVMIREGAVSEMNPLDAHALRAALDVREAAGGEITCLSMGPESATEVLRASIALGADRAFLISDRAYAGSDTWATSHILAEALKRTGPYDLVIAGERAVDGDTGQVGPGIAARLSMKLGAYVSRIEAVDASSITVERATEDGPETLWLTLPALLTVLKPVGTPFLPTLAGVRRARALEITRLTNRELQLPEEQVGLKGSPTRVAKVTSPSVTRVCRMVDARSDASMGALEIIAYMKAHHLLEGGDA